MCTAASIPADEVLAGLRRTIRQTPGAVLVKSFGCLGPCGTSAVVVVQRRRADRAANPGGLGPAVWIGVGDDSTLAHVAVWVGAGGPGAAPMPGAVDDAVIALT